MHELSQRHRKPVQRSRPEPGCLVQQPCQRREPVQAGAVRVIPSDPENSYLIHKLEGRSTIAGVRMPLGGPYLETGQILVIRRWIEIGAPNN